MSAECLQEGKACGKCLNNRMFCLVCAEYKCPYTTYEKHVDKSIGYYCKKCNTLLRVDDLK